MSKQKIKKGSGNPFEFWGLLNGKEKAVVLIPIILLIAVIVVLLVLPRSKVNATKGMLEAKLTSSGQWTKFEDYGIELWTPKDIAEEKLEGERAQYSRLYATRDKGGFPEITVGTFIVPNVETAGLDVATNPNDVMNIIRPYIYEEFSEMFNGVAPALNGDINIVDVEGENVLEFSGTAELTVVYKDPTGKRDNGEPYSELTDTNIYYMVRVFNGRPVCVWGTWDYSTYLGEENVKAAVRDGIVSIMRSDGAELRPIEGEPAGSDGGIVKEDGISSSDIADGLEVIPYQGMDGNQWDTPIDASGNPIDVEGWVPPEGENPFPADTSVEPETGDVSTPQS